MASPLAIPNKALSPYEATLPGMVALYGPVRTWARERHAEHTDLMIAETQRRGIAFKTGRPHATARRATP